MVGVLEVNAVSNLLSKGSSLALYIQEGYYKGSAARDDFPVQIDLLKKRHEEWSKQLGEHGMDEDPNIKSLLKSASKSLEEEEKKVRKIRNSLWKKVKILGFPDQLTLILKQIIDKIEAGPKLVASRVDNNDLLRKLAAQSRSVLPFGPDRKYVPIPSAVEKVQNALEDLSGPRAVTISGMPGLGKTGVAKHIALLYDEQLQQSLSQPCFPHGVHFLQCGKGANDRVRGLQGLLLQSLGFEAPPESSCSQIQERGDYMLLESNNSKLRSCLVKRKALIIFDDVWETELVQNLIVPGREVKYLITSQIKDVWNDALNVELEKPNMDQAIKIMARNTKVLSPPYEFSNCIKKEVEEIIRKLDFHPLSMTTVAVSIDHKRVTDLKTWKEVKENIQEQLQESDFHPNPLLYEMKYPLPVAASMMLMVNSLPQDPRELLFVTTLCYLYDNLSVKETIVKYFFQFLQPAQERYKSSKKYLEGRSIIESCVRDRWIRSSDEVLGADLTMHGLRRVFIREEKKADLRSTATSILSKRINETADKSSDANSWSTTATRILSNLKNWSASGNSDANIPNALRLQLAAVYGRGSQIFREVILQTTIHDAPWISSGKQALDLAESCGQKLQDDLNRFNLIPLLNVNSDAGGWEREANDLASKILLRWICRGELDDEGMARLLELPRTTSKACTALRYMFQWGAKFAFQDAFCYDQGPTFSSSNPKTMKTLKDLVHNNAAEPTRRAAVVAALGVVANYETEETIMQLAEKWAQMLADDSTPGIQFAAADALAGDHRLGFIMGACERVLEALVGNLKSIEDKSHHPLILHHFCQSKDNAMRIAKFPGALEKIMAAFVSDKCDSVPVHISRYDYWTLFEGFDHRLKVLLILSNVVEIKMKFVPVLSSLLQVVETLLPIDPRHWYGSSYRNMNTWNRNSNESIVDMLNAARIVGNLGLVTEIRDIILARPSIQRGLLNLLEGRSEIDQLNIFKCDGLQLCHFPSRVAARTLTILGVSYEVSSTSSALSLLRESAGPCALMYMGRAEAKEELGLFSEALGDLNTALDYTSQLIRPPHMEEELRVDHYLDKWLPDFPRKYDPIQKWVTAYAWEYGYPSWGVRLEILSRSAFLKGKIERYQDALKDVDSLMEMFSDCWDYYNWSALILKGILQRKSGNLQAAFNDMMKISINDILRPVCPYLRYKFSKQLQLLKRMSEDREGVKKEAEYTHLLVLRKVVWEPTTFGHVNLQWTGGRTWRIGSWGVEVENASVGLWHSSSLD